MKHFKNIPGFRGKYQASRKGEIRRTLTGQVLKQRRHSRGYSAIGLTTGGVTRSYYVHRLVAATFCRLKPSQQVDHRNGVKTDNRAANLRACNNAQNHWNRGKQKNNTSGHKGVYWHRERQRWCAMISANDRMRYLGLFEKMIDAVAAYKTAAQKLHRRFRHRA